MSRSVLIAGLIAGAPARAQDSARGPAQWPGAFYSDFLTNITDPSDGVAAQANGTVPTPLLPHITLLPREHLIVIECRTTFSPLIRCNIEDA